MYQQVNLYQPVFRQPSKIFSAVTLLKILAAVLLLLFAVYGHARWALGGLNHTAAALGNQQQQLNAQLGEIEASHVSATLSPIENEIAHLQQTIAERQALIGRIDRVVFRANPGFGGFFQALTLQTLPGLWLTGVRLTHEGETELRGTTLSAALVPRYLQQMPDQPRFKSLQQGAVHLSRHDPGKAEIDFTLRSNPRGSPM